jgi:hypothetical protein
MFILSHEKDKNMKLIKELGQKRQGSRNYLFALFKCPICLKTVEKIKKDGLTAKQCSRKCYTQSRTGVRRGAYLDFVIISGYRYRYAPKHPKAIGTKKLYVAEHRLVVESLIGRILKDSEIVHHKDENTLNNSPDNLELMSNSDHMKYHAIKRRRNRGRFTV